MHPYLRHTIDAFAARYRDDRRCAGMFLWGSAGAGTDDAWSDVDLALVVADRHFGAVAEELPDVCRRTCGPIRLWFPEGERPGYCNFAFLFEHDGGQFLYDFALMTRTALLEAPFRRPGTIVFDDATGTLAALQRERLAGPHVPARLPYEVEHYWIYCYLNGKYWQRQDLFKLLYIQQTLLGVHLRVLRALHAEAFREGEREWWPGDARRLPAATRPAVLRYFPAPEAGAVRAALAEEVGQFGADARAACARWGQPYPEALEAYVLSHLRRMGVLDPAPTAGPARHDDTRADTGTDRQGDTRADTRTGRQADIRSDTGTDSQGEIRTERADGA